MALPFLPETHICAWCGKGATGPHIGQPFEPGVREDIEAELGEPIVDTEPLETNPDAIGTVITQSGKRVKLSHGPCPDCAIGQLREYHRKRAIIETPTQPLPMPEPPPLPMPEPPIPAPPVPPPKPRPFTIRHRRFRRGRK